MIDSASLKVGRAAKHIDELNVLFQEHRPFTYVLEGNAKTGERAIYGKKNEAVIQQAALICGDVVHNIRAALDHAYWEIVSPHITKGQANVQFPFSKTAAHLDETIRKRLAHQVSDAFFKAMRAFEAHGERGGNELLYLIDQLDIPDKHRSLIPTANYKRLSSNIIRAQVPDFPVGLSNCGFGRNHRDVVWKVQPMSRIHRRRANVPHSGIFEQELDVPIDIVFAVAAAGEVRPVIPTLYQIADVATDTIKGMRLAAPRRAGA